jgi:hypothetical protein
VTEAEAKAECERLAAESPERHTHRWMPVERDGEWEVAKIGLAPEEEATGTAVRADERPPDPDDPRPAITRNIRGHT